MMYRKIAKALLETNIQGINWDLFSILDRLDMLIRIVKINTEIYHSNIGNVLFQ